MTWKSGCLTTIFVAMALCLVVKGAFKLGYSTAVEDIKGYILGLPACRLPPVPAGPTHKA